MLQFRPSRHGSLKEGFALIWVVLVVFLLGGIVIWGNGKFNSVPPGKRGNISTRITNISPSPVVSSEEAGSKPKSLYDLCRSEIENLPKLPFVYEKITPTGSNIKQYRQDRIENKKEFIDFASCGLDYSTINVIEKTYGSLGLQYYEYSKTDHNVKWVNYNSVKQLPKNIDNVYGEILKKQGWIRQTKEGGEDLSYGLPTLIYYKDMGDKNYYVDVVVGSSPANLYLLIVKK